MQPGKTLGPLTLSLLSVLIGVGAGLGAVVFRGLIAFFHNLLFLRKLSIVYDATIHTPPSPWGPFVILVPVVGAIGVAFIVKNFAPETKGTGVPEVIDAIYYRKGVVKPMIAALKSLASGLSLGSGASVGREGPIIQIGSAFGSTIGQIIRMPAWQRITLVAAGAGGGVAATFNTPVGGVLFATEIMLHEVSVRTLVPVAIASATGAYVGQNFFSSHPAFVIPYFQEYHLHIISPWLLVSYVGLGALTGIVSAIAIKSVYGFEDFIDKHVKGGYYVRHVLGMFTVGLTMYALMLVFGHYYIEDVGYSTIQDVLTGRLSVLYLLLLLAGLKLFALSMSLGSGASGGIFSPTLYMGATLGAAYGILLGRVFPGLAVSPPAFAVAGMAGAIGGTTGAAIAAIIMIFEMTLDYNAIIPMTVTVAVSYGIRRMIVEETMYTLKLARRGHEMPKAMQTNFYALKRAKDIMEKDFVSVPASISLEELMTRTLREHKSTSSFLLMDGDTIVGPITRDDALKASESRDKTTALRELAAKNRLAVAKETTLLDVIREMHAEGSSAARVVDEEGQVEGLITRNRLIDFVAETADLFAE